MSRSIDPTPMTIAGPRPWTTLSDAAAAAVDVFVEAGRITAITPAGLRSPVGRVVDAAGTWIGPGFVDPHVHLVMAGLGLRQLDLSAANSRAAFAAAIATEARRLDGADPAGRQWLLARGWDESRWGGERPTAAWLDAAGDRPAAAWRMDIHAVLVNDAALARLDLREPVPGGTIVRDAAGRPTGLLLEAAAWERVMPALPEPTAAAEREAVRLAMAHAHTRGLVAVGSMEYLDVFQRALVPLAEELTLLVRGLALDRELPLDIRRMRAMPRHPMVRLFAAKCFVDGTLGSRTARMLEPYRDADAADVTDDRGLLVERALDGTLEAWAGQAAAAGLGIAMHAIGDEAVRLALDAADAADDAAAAVPDIAPPIIRIEHAQHVDASDRPRFAGRFASMQPAHRVGYHAVMRQRVGQERADAAFDFAVLAAAGARLAFGSDWPVIDCDPMEAIAAAVAGITRDGPRPSGREIPVAAAIDAHTRAAWEAIDEPGRGGLATGTAADLVLLDADPGVCDWTRTRPRVLATVASGRLVHET